jgi:hypothetical protein
MVRTIGGTLAGGTVGLLLGVGWLFGPSSGVAGLGWQRAGTVLCFATGAILGAILGATADITAAIRSSRGP